MRANLLENLLFDQTRLEHFKTFFCVMPGMRSDSENDIIFEGTVEGPLEWAPQE